MNYYLLPLLLTLTALIPLLRAARSRETANADDIAAEQRALITHWHEQNRMSPKDQDEHDYRLYHDLKNLRTGKTSRIGSAPRWQLAAIPAAACTAFILWQMNDHTNSRRWHELQQQLEPVLRRSQYLGEIDNIPADSLAIYCQALQQHIDRSDSGQLATLARCYSRDSQYPVAAQIYARAHKQKPDDEHLALDYAQTTLFAHPDRPMPADIETILQKQSGKNPVAKILLAAGYTQNQQTGKAAPLWQELRQELAPDHPLYHLIPADTGSTAHSSASNSGVTGGNDVTNNGETAASEPTITITIAPDILHQLPSGARLYLSASLPGERIPLAVRTAAPAASQTLKLDDRDSMTGQGLAAHPTLTYRAILSADGNVSGKRLAEKEITAAGNATLTLALP